MRPFLKPSCLEELFELRERHPEAMVIAGGTDLLVRLRGEGTPDNRPFLSLKRIAEVHGILEDDASLCIGAAETMSRIMTDPRVMAHAPLLVRAVGHIGGPAIRNMATIGGNIATASPAGDSLPPLHLLGAEIETASSSGTRSLPIGEFITGPGGTVLLPGEIIRGIRLPKSPPFTTICFEKVGRRRSLAIAVASFGGMVRLAADGTVAEARLAWGSVGPTVARVPEAERALVGSPLTAERLESAAAIVRESVTPMDDIRASARYRRKVSGKLLFRLMTATNR